LSHTLDTYFILGIEDGSWKLYGTANDIGNAAEFAKQVAAIVSVTHVVIAQPTHQAEVKLVRDVVVLPTKIIKLPETPELSRDYKDPLIPLDYRPGKLTSPPTGSSVEAVWRLGATLSCCHYHNTGGPPSAHCGGERFDGLIR